VQNLIVLFVAVTGIFVGAVFDNSFILSGRATGLLEHPAVYCYFIAQSAVPLLFVRAVNRFWRLGENAPISTSHSGGIWLQELRQFRRATSLKTNFARIVYSVVTSVGIIAFVWNSYSNFHPERVGHDFWDSWHFQVGYWVTRVYKLYFWAVDANHQCHSNSA
jgi:hypothetical protein